MIMTQVWHGKTPCDVTVGNVVIRRRQGRIPDRMSGVDSKRLHLINTLSCNMLRHNGVHIRPNLMNDNKSVPQVVEELHKV